MDLLFSMDNISNTESYQDTPEEFPSELNLTIFSYNGTENSTLSEEYSGTGKVYWALLLIPLPLVAVIGNILVILSVYKEKSLQTVTNYFIVSLAFADLLVAAVVMPFAVYVLVSIVKFYCMFISISVFLFLFGRKSRQSHLFPLSIVDLFLRV